MYLSYRNRKINCKKTLLNLLLIFILICLIISPDIYMASILNGLILWAKAVLPALFPFFFLSKMLTELGSVKYISMYFQHITKRLFKVEGIASYAFIMSIFSGYPVGAKITSELYENGYITHTDMCKMCVFCSTSGPLFIIGTVGVGMIGSKVAGIVIFLCHFVGAILNGILWRNYKSKDIFIISKPAKLKRVQDDLLNYTITNSVISIAVVGGFISLFCMFVDIGVNTGVLGSVASILNYPLQLLGLGEYSLSMAIGIVEITRGSLEIVSVGVNDFSIVLITALISFGGISTHLQSLAFLGRYKIKYLFLFLTKFTQAIISGVVAYLFILLF